MRPLRSGIALFAALGTACSSVPADHGFDALVDQTLAAGQPPLVWPGVSLDEDTAAARVDALLGRPLTEDTAIELALLSNRSLRARYFTLRAALGDYRNATTLPNPFVSALVLEAEDEPVTNLSYGLGFEVLDIIFLPRRIKAAGLDLDAAQAETAATLIDFMGDVRVAFYQALATEQGAALADQAFFAADTSAKAALALHMAGNLAEVDLNREKLGAAAMRLEALKANAARASARERLNALLGLDAEAATAWTFAVHLAAAPDTPPTGSVRPADSLHLLASDARIDAAASRLGLAALSSLVGDVEFELERERDDGHWEQGLGIGFELPIFNTGAGARQAAADRLKALIEQRRADDVTRRAESRRLIRELGAAHASAKLMENDLLPLTRDILRGAELDYNAMQTGVFGLVRARQDELLAERDYIRALETYWVLHARFDQMVAGGSIGSAPNSQTRPVLEAVAEGDH